jgi:osomolarity two-component system response regulator SKN7
MNDVLPKPFTKEGMLRNLEKHLMQFKKNYVHPSSQPQSAVYPGYNATMPINQQPIDMSIAQISTTQSIKDENSPTKSPASSWHSPNQIAGQPSNTTGQASFTQMTSNAAYAITPAHPHAVFPQQPQAAAMSAPSQAGHRRVISDMPDMTAQDDHPDKRQRMYPPPQPGRYPQ